MPEITKRKVTMTSVVATDQVNDQGDPIYRRDQAVDYVPAADTEGGSPDILDAYVKAAKASGWQSVIVSDEPDAGPAGYHGATTIPDGIDHPAAGTTFDATDPKKKG